MEAILKVSFAGAGSLAWHPSSFPLFHTLKRGHSRPLFIYFRPFNIVDNKQVNKQMLNKNWS